MKKQLRAIAAFWHREYGRFVGITALAFLALTVLAYIVGRLVPNVPVTIIRTFNESIADAGIIRDDGSFSALALFGNNLRAMVMTVLYGFIPFLYLPALSLGLNAAIIGMLAALMDGQWLLLLAGLVPHGIFEVPALLLTGDRPGSARVGSEGLAAAARNPRITPVLVPGAGHQVRRSDPQAFYRAVDTWLAEVLPVG